MILKRRSAGLLFYVMKNGRTEAKKLLEVQNIVKTYGDVNAVNGISFKVEPGKIYGLLGKNGAGKSTTMNIMTGYIGATSGTVTIDGHDIFKEAGKAKKHIGYLPEIPPLYTDMTVYEYLEFCAQLKEVPKKERDSVIYDVMTQVQIDDIENRLIKNLSKGYKQRVGLAQALIGYPDIIILDEPTVGLDPSQMVEIRELIKELGKSHTVILSSHILSEIQAVCDYVFIIDNGRLIASDYVENLASNLNSTTELILSVKGDENSIRDILENIDAISEFNISNGENGSLCLVLKTNSNSDIRENLSMDLAKAGIVILEMKENKQSLEDIFIELTEKEEN